MSMGNINEDNLIIVDLILRRMSYGQAYVISSGFWSSLLYDKYDELGEEKYNKANQLLQTWNYREVITFLLEQGYIETVSHSSGSYMLIDKGKEARDKGGHAAFARWHEEQAAILAARIEQEKKEQRKINWPQKYWWAVALMTLFIGWVSDLGKEYIKARYFPEKRSRPAQTMGRLHNQDTSVIIPKDTHLLKK